MTSRCNCSWEGKQNAELNDLENSQLVHTEKNEKACSGKMRGLPRDHWIRRLVSHLDRSQELLSKTMGECKGGAAGVFWTWLASAPPHLGVSPPCSLVLINSAIPGAAQWLEEEWAVPSTALGAWPPPPRFQKPRPPSTAVVPAPQSWRAKGGGDRAA